MSSKVSIKAQSPDEKPYMAPAHSGVASAGLSASGMSSRVSRGVDVKPELLQPLPDDLEVRFKMLNAGDIKRIRLALRVANKSDRAQRQLLE